MYMGITAAIAIVVITIPIVAFLGISGFVLTNALTINLFFLSSFINFGGVLINSGISTMIMGPIVIVTVVLASAYFTFDLLL